MSKTRRLGSAELIGLRAMSFDVKAGPTRSLDDFRKEPDR